MSSKNFRIAGWVFVALTTPFLFNDKVMFEDAGFVIFTGLTWLCWATAVVLALKFNR